MANKESILEKLVLGAIALVSVLLFVFPRGVPIGIFLTITLGFFLPGYWANFKKSLKSAFTLLFAAFFVVHAISLAYSDNLVDGWMSLELKFSYLFIPVFLSPLLLSMPSLGRRAFKYMIAGALLSFGALLSKAFYDYFHTGNIGEFFGVSFAEIVHPSYLCLYLNVLIALICYNLIVHGKSFHKKKKLIAFSLLGLLSIFALLTVSKIGILILGLNALLIFIFFIVKTKKVLVGSGIFSAFVIVVGGALYLSPMKLKIEQMFDELKNPPENEKAYVMSTGMRLITWEISQELIAENTAAGVGIGDLRDELNEKYNEKEITGLIVTELDSHQQFLQTFATLGIAGIVLLCAIFLYLLFMAFRHRSFLLLAVTLFYLVFSFAESVFETQAGLVFFMICTSLLIFVDRSKLKLYNFAK